jgi:Tfp pilus assembly protein PilO
MKTLFGIGRPASAGRVLREFRLWVAGAAVLLALGLGGLLFGVLPLASSADAGSRRAQAASQQLATATRELAEATALRDAASQAQQDLVTFQTKVLPADVAAARRLTHLKLSQMARDHDVDFQRSASATEEVRESRLERLRVSYVLVGDYQDIRALIHAIETAPDFLVLDNVYLAEGAEPQAPLTLTLELSTFFRAPNRAP